MVTGRLPFVKGLSGVELGCYVAYSLGSMTPEEGVRRLKAGNNVQDAVRDIAQVHAPSPVPAHYWILLI